MTSKILNRLTTHKGFTLLEILVSLAILSISLSSILYVINQNTKNIEYLQDKTIAHWVAMNKSAELRLNPEPLLSNSFISGTYKMAYRNWQWSCIVKDTEDPELKRIRINVSLSEQSEDALASLEYFYSFNQNMISAGLYNAP
jgi:general secretion pathway protein I